MSDSEESSSSHDHDDNQYRSDPDPDNISSSSDEEIEQDSDHDDISKYHFCPDHKAGSMKKECSSCSAALSVISDPGLVSRLLSATDTNADAENLKRYKGRCDDVEPTISLSPSIVELAKETFNSGKFRDRKVWKDIIQKYLTLSHSDHLKLTEDISAEDVFNKFRGDKKYNYIFKFMSDMKEAIKDLRLAQRLLFSIIQNLNGDMTDLRKFGEDIGIDFPKFAPPRKGTKVPRAGGKVPDLLDYESCVNIFPRPDLSQFLAATRLTDDESEILEEMFDNYREDVVKTFMTLFRTQASALTSYDDKLIFYRSIYSHVDACLKDLMRDKMASFFKPEIKSEILSKSSSAVKDSSRNSSGLFGGNSKIRAALTKATKDDVVLQKAARYGRKRKNSSFIRDRSWTRSRSRSRSRERPSSSYSRGSRKSGYSKSDYQKKKGKSSSYKSKASSSKKSRSDKSKSD